ncbi:integral membrane protein S linking to the trans Golgi network-domain-containing protein [Pyronema domesticum]|nr:integral membrane protein S linking to the trans Golgi network-domain-containing protein [Pyronema domesticum]
MAKPPRRRRFRRGTSEPFQPLRTLLHIGLLQSIYYLTATLLILFTALVAGKPFNLDLIFSWRAVRGDTTVGWTLGIVWLLCAACMIISLFLIVARSKLILDFSLTIGFLHLIVVSLYEHEIPRSMLWWGLQFATAAVMILGGTWACQWRELRPMSFGLGDLTNPRGSARTTGGGGGGAYEMVPQGREQEDGETDVERGRG